MKILKDCITRSTTLKLPLLQSLRLVVLSWCVLLPAADTLAQQTEKQISYPVAVPAARTTTTSAASSAVHTMPAIKAPEPVIRRIEDAATPPARAKEPTKKVPTKNPPTKKASTKEAAIKEALTKKPPTAKPLEKSTKTKTTATKKPTATASATTAAKIAINSTAKKSTTKAASKTTKNTTPAAEKEPESKNLAGAKPKASSAKKPTQVSTPTTVAAPNAPPIASSNTPASPLKKTNLKLVVPVVAGAALVAASVSAEEEQQLARSLAEEGEYLAEPELPAAIVAKTTASGPANPAASAGPAAKTSLPMSNQREAFVTEFKNFVETKLVPRAPGLALAIIADGNVKVLQTYGVKKVGSSNLVNADTTFRIASVSKSFGATAAAMLVSDGLIRWDSKVTDILPKVEFSNPRYGDQLTVQHILSQATGLPTQTNSNFIEEGLSFDEIVRRLRYVNFVCPPGKCYNYQNVTYSLISDIVLKKTGMTYEQYVKNKIFHPLGMHTATVGFDGYSVNGNYAVPHIPTRKGWASTTVTEHYYRVNPAAGVNASITDMSRWVLAQMGQNPTVISPAILNAVHAKVTRNTAAQNHYGSREGVTDSHYGLGWRVFDYRGDKNFVHHGGGVKGFRSEVVFSPALKIGMVILTNGPRLSGDVIFEFLDAYEDEKRGERNKEAAPVNKKKK